MDKQACTSSYESNDGFAEQARAIEVVLGEELEWHAGHMQLVERFGHALAAKVVKALKQPHVKVPLVGIEQELLERGRR